MFQDLFIVSSSRHPVLVELTERYQVALAALRNLVTCRESLIVKRKELLIYDDSKLGFGQLYSFQSDTAIGFRECDVAAIRQHQAIDSANDAVDRLLPVMKRAIADFRISFSILSKPNVAMVKNNLLSAESLCSAIQSTLNEIRIEESQDDFIHPDFDSIDTAFEALIERVP